MLVLLVLRFSSPAHLVCLQAICSCDSKCYFIFHCVDGKLTEHYLSNIIQGHSLKQFVSLGLPVFLIQGGKSHMNYSKASRRSLSHPHTVHQTQKKHQVQNIIFLIMIRHAWHLKMHCKGNKETLGNKSQGPQGTQQLEYPCMSTCKRPRFFESVISQLLIGVLRGQNGDSNSFCFLLS